MSDRSYTSRFYRDPDSHIADQAFVTGQLKKRIAELEAELADEKRLTEAAWRGHAEITTELVDTQRREAVLARLGIDERARAEKAEAEVERLHAICRWPIFCGIKEASP